MFEHEELDWEPLPDGRETEAVTALIDGGFKTVPEYRRDRHITDRDADGQTGWNLPWYGDWRQMLPPGQALSTWEDDRDTLHIHDASYAVFERYGHDWCTVHITASAVDDIDPDTGYRIPDAAGSRGHLHITGLLPGDVDTERYVEQHLEPDA